MKKKLFNAVLENNITLVMDILKTGEVNIDTIDTNGKTLLHYASMHNTHTEMGKLLVKLGANIKIKDNYGRDAIAFAEEYGSDYFARFLYETQFHY